MITLSDFKKMITLENELIQRQTDGLSHPETLLQPQHGGNCMNWVLGHLLTSQIEILDALGAASPIDRLELARYERESEPIRADEPGVKPLDFLLDAHTKTSKAILARLNGMNDADFEEDIQVDERKVNRGWRVFFLHFHYTYHIGQLEQLRQLAGKTEKIV